MTDARHRLPAVPWDVAGTLVETEPSWLRAETEFVRGPGGDRSPA